MARLRNINVVQTMAMSLEALVQGEIMQIRATPDERLQMGLYIQKSFFKTASLIAYSCKSAALLGGHAIDSEVTTAAYTYGYHLGTTHDRADSRPQLGCAHERAGERETPRAQGLAQSLMWMRAGPSLVPCVMGRVDQTRAAVGLEGEERRATISGSPQRQLGRNAGGERSPAPPTPSSRPRTAHPRRCPLPLFAPSPQASRSRSSTTSSTSPARRTRSASPSCRTWRLASRPRPSSTPPTSSR